MKSRAKEAMREIPQRELFVLDANYQVEYSSRFATNGHLPLEIKRKARELTMTWGTDPETYPEGRCILSSGVLMRVFRLSGDGSYRIGISLESYRERAETKTR